MEFWWRKKCKKRTRGWPKIEEEKLVNAEKTEQEAYTEYNDLIIKDKENIKEYEEEEKNLIIIEKSIEEKLKDIKKINSFNYSGKVKRI